LIAGLNTYAYVDNNPLKWTDPKGLVKAGIKKMIQAACVVIGMCNAAGHIGSGKAGQPPKIPGPSREQAEKVERAREEKKIRRDIGSKPSVYCPLDPFDMAEQVTKQACLDGDTVSCGVYQTITGETVLDNLTNEECLALGLCT
jgi:hypothetical protein